MASITCLVLLAYLINCGFANPVKVHEDVHTCASTYHQGFLAGGIKHILVMSDPMSLDFIPGNLPDLKYELTDAKLFGLGHCNVTHLRIHHDILTLDFDLECPRIELDTKYIFAGKLANMSIEEEGHITSTSGLYIIKVRALYDRKLSEHKKEYAHIKFYHLDVDAMEHIGYKFTFTHNENKDKLHSLHKYMNEHWKSVDEELRSPILNSFMDVGIIKLNHFLKFISFDEVF